MYDDEQRNSQDQVDPIVKKSLDHLKRVGPRPGARKQILCRMREAGAAETGSDFSAKRHGRKPWWRRNVNVPVPAFAAMMVILMWLGWGRVVPVTATDNVTVVQPELAKSSSPTDDPDLELDEDFEMPVERMEVAVYIPTIGYVARKETNSMRKEQ